MGVELIVVASDAGVMHARQKGRELAMTIGITGSDLTLLATAISEIARNIVQYAGSGEIEFRNVVQTGIDDHRPRPRAWDTRCRPGYAGRFLHIAGDGVGPAGGEAPHGRL